MRNEPELILCGDLAGDVKADADNCLAAVLRRNAAALIINPDIFPIAFEHAMRHRVGAALLKGSGNSRLHLKALTVGHAVEQPAVYGFLKSFKAGVI